MKLYLTLEYIHTRIYSSILRSFHLYLLVYVLVVYVMNSRYRYHFSARSKGAFRYLLDKSNICE